MLEDVCAKDDYECQHPDDVGGIGHLLHNKSQNINILRRLQRMSMLQCVKECFTTSQCIAINYRKNWKLCDILDKLPDGEKLQNESGSIYSKLSSWPKSLAGGCADKTCQSGRKCEKQTNGGFGCTHVSLRPHDCGDIPEHCPSAVYTIYSTGSSSLDVYCDMETAGGRNTVIHTITSSEKYELYIHLEDFDGKTAYAKYSTFNVEDFKSNFMLHISGYTGTAGDGLNYHDKMMFTTKDKDNDRWKSNCAGLRIGAWWYNRCIHSNLNGKYGNRNSGQIFWRTWTKESLKSTRMMIKKTSEQ
ncbi:unnamed protein product [Mytilus edulis]|uniref:Fibrinogen C-terminal domain-containing protein n=1 Tax=Mytilus edulis TaxID=6550 RepID=A0A8S3VPI6_MYTED|nr:unnamed protein product [Mytilus edulis]